jgi:hypothetical protein
MPTTRPRRIRITTRAPITLALLLVLAFASCAFPEEGSDGSLDGSYYLNGVDRDGVEYSGTLVIDMTDDPDVYQLQWIVTGSIQTGTGTVDGESLMIEWNAMEGFDAASHGTGRYDISPEGDLSGERTVAGQEGVATEEAFPIK